MGSVCLRNRPVPAFVERVATLDWERIGLALDAIFGRRRINLTFRKAL